MGRGSRVASGTSTERLECKENIWSIELVEHLFIRQDLPSSSLGLHGVESGYGSQHSHVRDVEDGKLSRAQRCPHSSVINQSRPKQYSGKRQSQILLIISIAEK